MECKFVVGQKVLCIETDEHGDLIPGEIYTIVEVVPFAYDLKTYQRIDEPAVGLKEIGTPGYCYAHTHFKPLEDASLEWARQLCLDVDYIMGRVPC